MAIRFLTGQRLTADLLNANVADFFPATFAKSAATARTNNATLADDPELQGIPLSVGTWEIELLLFWTQTTSSTQKIKTRWFFTGTWATTAIRGATGGGDSANTDVRNIADMTQTGAQVDAQNIVYSQLAGTAYGFSREVSRTVVVSAAGNMSLQWAQNTSAANATTVQPSSSFTIRKIA